MNKRAGSVVHIKEQLKRNFLINFFLLKGKKHDMSFDYNSLRFLFQQNF